MAEPTTPALSVVLACMDAFPTVARTVAALTKQDCANRIELILVAPSARELAAEPAALAAFHSWRCVELGPLQSIAQANAAGVRAASAEVVALAEDHCFPEPGWASALIAAHQQGYAAVGPVVRNANPASAVSWSDYLIGYGAWAPPCAREERPFLPGHNSSYKRAVLERLDDEALEAALEAETVFHFELVKAGERLLLEPAAVAAHMNLGKARSWIPLQFHNGRVFAAARMEGRLFPVRFAYALCWPGIAAIRFLRSFSDGRRTCTRTWDLVRTVPWLAVGLSLDALGQAAGALAGAGGSPELMKAYEFRRVDHVAPGDLRALGD